MLRLCHASGVSVCERHEAPGSSAGPEGTWHPDGVTELLCFEGLGKVLPRGGAVELSFEDRRVHQVKGGPG